MRPPPRVAQEVAGVPTPKEKLRNVENARDTRANAGAPAAADPAPVSLLHLHAALLMANGSESTGTALMQAALAADTLPAGSPSALMMEALEAAAEAAQGWWSDRTGAALAQVRACLCTHYYSKPASMVMHLQECLEHEQVEGTQQLWWVRQVLRECALRDLPVPPDQWLRI